MISEKKAKDIDNIVLEALSKSNALGTFPTPVDNILKYADLRVSAGFDLSNSNIFTKSLPFLKKGIAKIRGVLDRQEKLVYLDLTQLEVKKRFVKLHETGHELCSWQGKLHNFLDDDETLDPDTKELFEAEANYFASASLFQLGIFSDKIAELPLEITSAIQLSKTFGSSVHAALRRYVEKSKKRCALLVLNKEKTIDLGRPKLTIRNYFQSKSFTAEWGDVNWGSELDIENPFVQGYMSNRKFFKSELYIDLDQESIHCTYDYFYNGYNIFIFMYPKGETIKSRTSFIVAN